MLRSHQGHPCLIPVNGTTLQEPMILVISCSLCSPSTIIGEDLWKHYIHTSELGSWILEWCAIPRHTFIMDVWTAHPACVTYDWLKSLRALLHIFQRWTMLQRMRRDHGCMELSSGDQTNASLCMDVKMLGLIWGGSLSLLDKLVQWDQALAFQWLQQSGNVDDAKWLHPVPADHLVQPAKWPQSDSE